MGTWSRSTRRIPSPPRPRNEEGPGARGVLRGSVLLGGRSCGARGAPRPHRLVGGGCRSDLRRCGLDRAHAAHAAQARGAVRDPRGQHDGLGGCGAGLRRPRADAGGRDALLPRSLRHGLRAVQFLDRRERLRRVRCLSLGAAQRGLVCGVDPDEPELAAQPLQGRHDVFRSEEARTYWIASIRYTYAIPSTDPQVRRWNPLGFKVVDFRSEEEVGGARPPDLLPGATTARTGGGGPS